MRVFVSALLLLAGSASAQNFYYKPYQASSARPARSSLSYEPAPSPAKYDFEWQVQDAYSGNDFGHQESRDDAKTTGSYHVALPDGRVQRVTYFVDGYGGYHAEVTYEGEAKYPAASEARPVYAVAEPAAALKPAIIADEPAAVTPPPTTYSTTVPSYPTTVSSSYPRVVSSYPTAYPSSIKSLDLEENYDHSFRYSYKPIEAPSEPAEAKEASEEAPEEVKEEVVLEQPAEPQASYYYRFY